jgi:predicted membrane channel-forming protein YqfA (hemolysin III family)
MTTGTKDARVIIRILSLVLIVTLFCDSFKADFIVCDKEVTLNKIVFYILPGPSVVIDLNSIVKQSYTNASLSISHDPLRGNISLDTHLLNYKPL